MRKFSTCTFLFFLMVYCLQVTASSAIAKRLALVVGNSTYEHLPFLPSPKVDAADIGDVLVSIGFDEVLRGEDLTRKELIDKLADFTKLIEPGDTALFYYSGHGADLGGNYYIPIDAPEAAASTEQQFRNQGVAEAQVISDMQNRAVNDEKEGAVLLIIDACRNFPAIGGGVGKGGGQEGGLASPAASGIAIIYAAGFGQIAFDRLNEKTDKDRNSVFTRALIPLLKKQDMTIDQIGAEVRKLVAAMARTAKLKQVPVLYAQNENPIILNPGSSGEKQTLLIPNQAPKTDKAECDGVHLVSPQGGAKCLRAGDEFVDCEDCPRMVVVPAGSFIMGSPATEKERDDEEGPQREVTIRQPFAVGKFEVTRGQYDSFVEQTGHQSGSSCAIWTGNDYIDTKGKSFRNPGYEQNDAHPVACVSWLDTQAYVRWLSEKTGASYRLLSEAEWEYSARAGTTTAYSMGDSITTAEANFDYTLGGTAKVGSYRKNDFGLHDMYGNVFEWVEDCYSDSYKNAPDDGTPFKDFDGCHHRRRGGSWDFFASGLRSAYRGVYSSEFRGFHLGFRLARTL